MQLQWEQLQRGEREKLQRHSGQWRGGKDKKRRRAAQKAQGSGGRIVTAQRFKYRPGKKKGRRKAAAASVGKKSKVEARTKKEAPERLTLLGDWRRESWRMRNGG